MPGLALVVLHGSRARGDARPDSDVDVAILADAPLDSLTLLDLQTELEPHLGAEVDLVDVWTSDDVLRVQVIDHGSVAFERSRLERQRFEMRALSRYAFLNEERAAILDDVRRRGTIHG